MGIDLNYKMEAEPNDDILGPKRKNYQFLQLVRDKNYPEALIIGKASNHRPIQSFRKLLTILQSEGSSSSSKKMQKNVMLAVAS